MSDLVTPSGVHLGRRASLALRVWTAYLRVRLLLRRHPLPEVVDRLGRPRAHVTVHPAPRLNRATDRSLRLGPVEARCLTAALVLYDLLRSQGDPAELVIGLPAAATGPDAHAWVEVRGRVVGPPPGRAGHDEMVRYGS